MSWISQAKNFVFSQLLGAAARAASTSANAAVQQAGQQAVDIALQTTKTAAQNVIDGVDQHLSPVGVINPVVATLEGGLKDVVDLYVGSTVGALPMVGGMIAPEAVALANAGLDFVEQHIHNYVAALFAHHKASVADNTAQVDGVDPAAKPGA